MPFFDQYPYTNFHNVNLDWILERVKEWGQMVEDNNTRFENLLQANEDFKSYVENYLQDLDVQEEINIKMDSLLESGVLTEYLQPYISEDVTTWLNDNITEPVGVVIDSSLTVAGAAADSKETGLRINSIFTQNAKNILLTCFRNMLFTVSGADILYKNLQLSLLSGDVFNKWRYSIAEGDLLIKHATCDPNQNDLTKYPSRISYRELETRRTVCLNYGLAPYYVYNENGVSSELYPIPIPMTANKVKISITPNLFLFMSVVPYDDTHNYYLDGIVANRILWTQIEGSITKDITREDGKQLFIVPNIKYNDAGTSFPTEPESVVIEFLV